MNILSLYFLRRTASATGLLWLGLTLLIATLETVASLDDRSLEQSLLLAILHAPRLALETLPFAVTIGAAAALQRMTETRELEAMRAAGLSLRRIAFYASGCGALFAVVFVVANELILEPAESLARAVQGQSTATGDIWLENEGTYFHARELSANGIMQNVAVYQASGGTLNLITAKTAKRQNNQDAQWLIENGESTTLAAGVYLRTHFNTRQLNFPLPSSALKALIRRPREMSMAELYAAKNFSGGARFASEFWQRLAAIPALVLLAACAVWCIGGIRRRPATTALIATALSGGCYFATIIFTQFAQLLQAPPLAMLSLIVPLIALISGIRRQFI